MAKKAQYATRTTSPFEKGNLSKSGRVGFFDQSFSKNSFDLSWTNTKALMDSTQAVATKAGLNLQFTGDASSGAPSSGSSEIFGLIAGLIVLLFLFRALVPTVIPLIFAIIAVASAFMLLYLGRTAHEREHDHADHRVDDRARRRHRLLAVHRHAVQTAAA